MYFNIFLNKMRTTNHGFTVFSFGHNSTGCVNLTGLVVPMYRHIKNFLPLMQTATSINPSFPNYNLDSKKKIFLVWKLKM